MCTLELLCNSLLQYTLAIFHKKIKIKYQMWKKSDAIILFSMAPTVFFEKSKFLTVIYGPLQSSPKLPL